MPVTFYADRKKFIVGAAACVMTALIGADMATHPRSSLYQGDTLVGYALVALAVLGLGSLAVAMVRGRVILSITAQGLGFPRMNAVSWSEVSEFKVIEAPAIHREWIGVVMKDRDAFYRSLSPAMARVVEFAEKQTGASLVIPPAAVRGDLHAMTGWLNECRQTYSKSGA